MYDSLAGGRLMAVVKFEMDVTIDQLISPGAWSKMCVFYPMVQLWYEANRQLVERIMTLVHNQFIHIDLSNNIIDISNMY